jgi:flagellar motility protein MotE (MotC chaperone)
LGLLFDGGYTLGQPRQALAEVATEPAPKPGRAAAGVEAAGIEVGAGRPDRSLRDDTPRAGLSEVFGHPDVTASTQAPKPKPTPEAGADAAPPADSKPAAGETIIDPDRPRPSAGERAVLENLNQRRQELEARARELDVRENLLAAAEKRIETRLGELKELEARITAADRKREEEDAARFKGLVIMYESMKAKDAAKIFDRLDLKILLEVATQMNPRRMSDILAQMVPEAAERLTVAIANRSATLDKGRAPPDLPKIEGRPNGT